MRSFSPIPKSRHWMLVTLAAALPLIDSLFWTIVGTVDRNESLSQSALGNALPPMFPIDAFVVVTGIACLLSYAIALGVLLARRRFFIFVYGVASILRVSIWAGQIFNYDFPGIIGYFLLAVDTAVVFAGLHWYQDRKSGGDRTCKEANSRVDGLSS
ncbi:hypothetical protein [Maricaulis sp. MIT060901]|uniref:hypothetical protein n=1 Tax=Maricaulis sp. MIT060901 TaxID=3096993 RepID=UPI00399B1A38